MRDQQNNTEHERCHHQNGAQRLDLWKKNVDQIECTAKERQDAEGSVEVHVNINGLPSSTADLMLDTTFENAEALKGYSVHPAHVAVADGKVRPYTKARFCLDYEI